jgi:long-chain fatty acid transport protein
MTTTGKFKLIGVFILLLYLFTPEIGFTGGFMMPYQTARGLALSNALTAGIDDPSAVFYNPAGLSEIDGNQLLLTGLYVHPRNSVENGGRKAVNRHDDNLLASLFANYHITGSDFTVGIGTYTPFGLATTYDAEFTRFAAQRTELRTTYVTPAVAWHPSKYFSTGAGLSFVHASGTFSRALCFDFLIDGCSIPGGPLEGRLRLTDTTNAFTYNLGVLLKPSDNWKVGLSYRARADLRFDKADIKLRGPFSTASGRAEVRPLPLPPVFNAGVFWHITPSWGAEFVYEYTRWSEFKTLSATFSPTPLFVPLGAPIAGFSLPQSWKDTSTLRFGSFFRPADRWEIRGGLGLEETPIPSRTLNPAIPGADLFTLNAGLGYKWQKFNMDFGYTAVFYETRRTTNSELEGIPATGIPFQGAPGKDKYQNFGHLVSVSLGYRF